MSEQRTVESLTEDDLGSTVEVRWDDGESMKTDGPLEQITHGVDEDGDPGGEGTSLAWGKYTFWMSNSDTPCRVTPGGPQ